MWWANAAILGYLHHVSDEGFLATDCLATREWSTEKDYYREEIKMARPWKGRPPPTWACFVSILPSPHAHNLELFLASSDSKWQPIILTKLEASLGEDKDPNERTSAIVTPAGLGTDPLRPVDFNFCYIWTIMTLILKFGLWVINTKPSFQPFSLKKEEGNGPLFSNLAVS